MTFEFILVPEGELTVLIDSYHRHITYLRLSVTDRCNLRCRYCMPENGVKKIDHKDILTYEEFLMVVRAASSAGMTKIRLTGGEPLIRKGILDFIAQLASLPTTLDLRLTTNGVLLSDMAQDLLQAGIRRVNISLDSLSPTGFHQIAGHDVFDRVWKGLETAIDVGFDRVKLNVVVIRGFNDHELPDFVRLTRLLPIEVRFIEFMPLGQVDYWSRERMISVQEMKEKLRPFGELIPQPRDRRDGPARVFRLEEAPGSIGFISPVSDHFCATCNRLRLTADGKLRLCLLSNREMDLRTPIRTGATEPELAELLRQAVLQKPGRHALAEDENASNGRSMNLIGG